MQAAQATNLPELLTPIEVSEILRVPRQTLNHWRLTGAGPNLPFIRVGQAVRYRRLDVEAILSNLQHRTARPQGAAAGRRHAG